METLSQDVNLFQDVTALELTSLIATSILILVPQMALRRRQVRLALLDPAAVSVCSIQVHAPCKRLLSHAKRRTII